MSLPKVIIEIRNGALEAVYSNTDLSIFLATHNDEENKDPQIAGPYSPTLVKDNLTKVLSDGPPISPELLNQPPDTPFF